ncbi:hypothetical protein OD350_28730 (plasmid) [Clostridium beijerinckii]|uniref:hypothetical protein n=1 Tax=Clostridium beijerinckii TaxID=1520 RepID=UPI0022272163|nr:hypothetical protein [Clostridium beijerinckii]UYZ39060.1 hypothetical protein OD350_28730 [Clostridium beijerinckii]
MNKIMNLRTREFLVNGLVGIMWIIYGMIQILDVNKSVGVYGKSIFIIIIMANIVPYLVKTEIQDEMAKHNMDIARSKVCELLIVGMLICSLLSTVNIEWMSNIQIVMSFLIGIGELFKYIIFVIYEKNGD